MDPNGTIKLVDAILRGTPPLPSAACRGRYELYDEIPGQSREARAQRCELAADLCSRCAARARCPGRQADRLFSRTAKNPPPDALSPAETP